MKRNNTSTIMNLIRSDRTVRALLLAIILIIIMGSLRPNTTSGMYEKKYWATKVGWQNYADVVITGDSRVLGGISPGKMKETLTNRCIVNYGFASNLYDSQYLDSVETVLKEESENKTIILGITPHSLTEDPDITGQFVALKSLSKQDIFIHMHFAAIMSFFEYMSYRDALLGIFPGLASSHTHKELFADGWLAYSKKPSGKKKELKKYMKIYERCHVTQKMIDNLLGHVTRWTESGINVYGFLVPTCKEMVELEEQYSGLNLPEFKEAFQNAGGNWIEVDPTAYDSFDGSHLQRESAVELSKLLALKISETENKR